jgi:SAM-dependent methyltransferase
MKRRLLQWLVCPTCRSPDLQLTADREESRPTVPGSWRTAEGPLEGVDIAGNRGTVQEVIEGTLNCHACGTQWPIRDGVPRMRPASAEVGPATAHRWTTFDKGRPEWEEHFLDLAAPLKSTDFLGQTVLDVGCGYGRHAWFAARYGAEVLAIDSSPDAVASCVANTRLSGRVHVIEADIHALPVRDRSMDITWSFGLLHHLADPEQAFQSLDDTVRDGGRLAVWVYGPRQGLTLHASNALRGATKGMTAEQLFRFSRNIARGLRLFSHTPYRWFESVPIAGAMVRHLPVHEHHQWPFDVVVADVWDRLRIPVQHWFPREKLEVMFTNAGYVDVSVSRRVRNSETFRASGTRR